MLRMLLQAQPAGQGGGGLQLILMMLAIFVIMYFLMIRPQKKKQKQLEEFRRSLQRGDKVVTVGGIYGTVDEIAERHIVIEVDKNVKIRVDKSSVLKDFTDAAQK